VPFVRPLVKQGYYKGMRKSVYIETSIPSYLTARPSRDVRVAAWQQLTAQWWEEARNQYDLFTSELTLLEAAAGNAEAAERRLGSLKEIAQLAIDEEARDLATRLISQGGVPAQAEADALHIAISAVHRIDYLLTWNCRHIDNATRKPMIRAGSAIFYMIFMRSLLLT